jgi:hypothetical protein
MKPEARQEKLWVHAVGDELIVYDRDRHRVHRLNQTAALVWQHCDGSATAAEMAAQLEQELGSPVTEELVWLALERLDRAQLLTERLPRTSDDGRMSRRSAIAKMGLAGAVALAIPAVTSIVAPTPAMAGSPGDDDHDHDHDHDHDDDHDHDHDHDHDDDHDHDHDDGHDHRGDPNWWCDDKGNWHHW